MASGKPKKKNPRLASGRKRVRQDIKINAANTSLRSQYRTAVKNVEKAVLTGDKAKATELFGKMQAVVDTVADKGIFHKNKAARDKSRLSSKVKALAVAAGFSGKPHVALRDQGNAVCNGCAVSKSKKAVSRRLFCFLGCARVGKT